MEIPVMLLIQIVVVIIPVAVIGGGVYLAVRYVRALEQRGPRPGNETALRERVERLEEQLERTVAELERLEEGQRFMQRLLSERAAGDAPATGAHSLHAHQP